MSRDIPIVARWLPRLLMALYAAVTLGTGVLCGGLIWNRSEVLRFEDPYQQIESGMTRADMHRLMGGRGTPYKPYSGGGFWEYDRLPPEEATRIVTAERYRFRGYAPFSMFWEITYDARGRVVGKHRFD